ncbi:MAG: response regulator transcription factor [Gammaproteobacteria bacterium]|nr:response regulator transcription factor [Gammaproteobacteria bacterium]
MIRVVVVDDQRIVRDCLRVKLESDRDIRVVAEASTGEEARRVVPQAKPDVVLMDLGMPGIGGIEATRRLVQVLPHIKVVALSVYVDGPFPAKFLAAGGVGYVSKFGTSDELVNAVKLVHQGRPYLSRDVLQALIVDGGSAGGEELARLSDREVQVLKLIAEGCDPDDVATQLKLSVKTVHTHRRHLLRKLGVKNDVQLARMAQQYGVLPRY